jgi:3',5'-cyclic AMP phosphodiesterase CpdA
MKIVHLTDLHLTRPGDMLWGLDPWARLDACLADIAAYHGDAAFCAVTGDLAERGEIAAYEALRRRLESFPLDTHLILGNHDDRANFLKVFGGADPNGHVQHAIERNGAHHVFLDTLKAPSSSAGLYDAARRSWFAAELERAKGKPVYIFMHHPPFAIGHALMDRIGLEEPEAFASLLDGHDIRHIFFGHAHRPIGGRWRGIPFSSLPGLAHQVPLVEGSVTTVYSEEPAMYGVVLIEADRTVVHADAFLNRAPAQMPQDAERDNWF